MRIPLVLETWANSASSRYGLAPSGLANRISKMLLPLSMIIVLLTFVDIIALPDINLFSLSSVAATQVSSGIYLLVSSGRMPASIMVLSKTIFTTVLFCILIDNTDQVVQIFSYTTCLSYTAICMQACISKIAREDADVYNKGNLPNIRNPFLVLCFTQLLLGLIILVSVALALVFLKHQTVFYEYFLVIILEAPTCLCAFLSLCTPRPPLRKTKKAWGENRNAVPES